MNKVSFPAVLLVATVVVVILFLVKSIPSEDYEKRIDSTTSSVSTDPRRVPTETVDKEGRWVVMLGEVELRIPKEMGSITPATAYDRYPTALCLREQDELGRPGCQKLADRIRIFLMARSIETSPPNCNVDRDYSDDILNGPFATSNSEVDLYRSDSKATRTYVYRKHDETCWHPTATCSPLRCLTSFYLGPGVSVRYEFSEEAIEGWPAIHKRILDHVTYLVVWQ